MRRLLVEVVVGTTGEGESVVAGGEELERGVVDPSGLGLVIVGDLHEPRID